MKPFHPQTERVGFALTSMLSLAVLTNSTRPVNAGTFWDENDYVIAAGLHLVVLNEDFTYKDSRPFQYSGFYGGSLDWLPNGDLVVAARGAQYSGTVYHFIFDSDGNKSELLWRSTGLSDTFEVKVSPNGTDLFVSDWTSQRTERVGPGGVLQSVGHSYYNAANAVAKRIDGTHELWVGSDCDVGGLAIYPLAADGTILTAHVARPGFGSAFHAMTFDPRSRRMLFPQSVDCSSWWSFQKTIRAIDTETRTQTQLYAIPEAQMPSIRFIESGATLPGAWFSGVTAGENGRVVAVESHAGWGVITGTIPGRFGLSVWEEDATNYRFIDLENLAGFGSLVSHQLASPQNIVWTGNSPVFRDRAPAVNCPQPTEISCVPAAGLAVDISVTVTDPDAGEVLTVSLRSGSTPLGQQTISTPVADAPIVFRGVELAPGEHKLTVEASDGSQSVTCGTRLTLVPCDASPVVRRVRSR